MLNRARTSVLEIAHEESGPADGLAVLLMHGFPTTPAPMTTWCPRSLRPDAG